MAGNLASCHKYYSFQRTFNFFPIMEKLMGNPDVVSIESAISERCVGGGGKMETFPDLSAGMPALTG